MSEGELFPGFGVGGYRCYGTNVQLIGPLDRLNLLIGPNNVGKSSALRLFSKHLEALPANIQNGKQLSTFDQDDVRSVRGEARVPFQIRWPVRREFVQGLPAAVGK